MRKRLNVIMPLYTNSAPVLEITERCIQKVLEHVDDRFDTRLITVDNGSLLSTSRDIDVRWRENKGVAPAWNAGWKVDPHADFFCWINADCEVTPGWSFPLLVACEQLPVIAMPYTNGEKSDGIGITGWCFMASRETANRIGPFDETFAPAQYEDTDWFHRAIYQHKIALVNVPQSNVIHERKKGGTETMPHFQERWKYLHLANRYRYAWKHGVDPEGIPPFWKSPLPDVKMDNVSEVV